MQHKRYDPRTPRDEVISTRSWQKPSDHTIADMDRNVVLECGWGRLIFGQTFDDQTEVAKVLRSEAEGRRDIALYLRDPHVLVAKAPDELFIDPSLTYRLWFHQYRPAREPHRGVVVRKMRTQVDAEATNHIYALNGMVTADPEVMWANQRTRAFTYLVAEDADGGEVIGTVTGIDHTKAFKDPEKGTSGMFSANQEVVVGSGDVEGVNITLGGGGRVTGRVRIEGRQEVPKYTMVMLTDKHAEFFGGGNAQVKDDGTFEIEGVNAGTYQVVARSGMENNTYYLKEVRLGGQDVRDALGVSSGGVSGLEILLGADGGTVSGRALTEESLPLPGAMVMLVPAEEKRIQTDTKYGQADQLAGLAVRSPAAARVRALWLRSPGEWTARAGWDMVAHEALHDFESPDSAFEGHLQDVVKGIHAASDQTWRPFEGAEADGHSVPGHR